MRPRNGAPTSMSLRESGRCDLSHCTRTRARARMDQESAPDMMAASARQKSLIIPREHGAWGILLVPLVTGASVGLLAGGSAASLAPVTIAALALFWLRTPVESWMGTGSLRARTPDEIQFVRNTAAILAAVSIGALTWLFWGGRNPVLLWIGAAAGAAFLAQSAVKRIWRNARTAAQMI